MKDGTVRKQVCKDVSKISIRDECLILFREDQERKTFLAIIHSAEGNFLIVRFV